MPLLWILAAALAAMVLTVIVVPPLRRRAAELLRLVLPVTKLLWSVSRDRSFPWMDRALPLLALVYLVSPIDLVPDVVPFSHLDDFVVLVLAVRHVLVHAGTARLLRRWRGTPHQFDQLLAITRIPRGTTASGS